MATNTYLPHVGGVARSVDLFTQFYRSQGHNVLVVAPQFEGDADESGVARVPALQNFNGSDFSVRLPIPAALIPKLEEFKPDIVHSHHPFLLGDTALRIGARWNVPVVFTHHTMYERYTHYVPGSSGGLQRAAVRLATDYANLCQSVIAPSESVRDILIRRGVTSPIAVIPTGVDVKRFGKPFDARFRERCGIPEDVFLAGHVGRLAPEKNLEFLAKAVRAAVVRNPRIHFAVVGEGPSELVIRRVFEARGLEHHLHLVGRLTGQELIDAYHMMDIFVFASQTETQGMVLAEAMAAGLPVIALDACGAREVVRDGENGLLLPKQRLRDFTAAVLRCADLEDTQRRQMQAAARDTAQSFAQDVCAQNALDLYARCLTETDFQIEVEGSSWEATLRLLEMEWLLFRNRARAAARLFSKLQIVSLVERLRRFARYWLSRAEWAVRLLRLEDCRAQPEEPGLLMIQVDGLARKQFEQALRRGRLPFMRKLLQREGYSLFSFYSGIPSTTAAVQGELFYGVKQAVPAFAFIDPRGGQQRKMVEPDAANGIELELKRRAEGLLKGGSCYSNIYEGGADEAYFCPSALGWQGIFSALNPLTWLLLLLVYAAAILRILLLAGLEFVLSFLDALAGAWKGYLISHELKFILSRLSITIVLREMITAGAIVDLTRGLPIVHLNFLGYDEHAHRRGPESFFAHWSLKGIDNAIRRLWYTAKRSRRRAYQVWIYSDHGQEQVNSYCLLQGKTIEEAVDEVLKRTMTRPQQNKRRKYRGSVELERARWLGGAWLQKLLAFPRSDESAVRGSVAAVGPIGFVYAGEPVGIEKRREIAKRLVQEAAIPLVLTKDEDGKTVLAFTPAGEGVLPRDAEILFDESLPYLAQLVEDFCMLFEHRLAGEWLISGWRKKGKPLTFVVENGAHGGPGPQETTGFLCLPNSYRRDISGRGYLRPAELRLLALRHLKRAEEPPLIYTTPVVFAPSTALRVMTYNVHSCLGMDGRRSPERIAEVIARYEPAIVCLQELDAGRPRSGGLDQAEEIARLLEMNFHFSPALRLEEERYGDAILSRFPMRLIQAEPIARAPWRPDLEPRGALWVEVEVDSKKFQLLNTHLGLYRPERELQAYELLGKKWLGQASCADGTILCGDLNAIPNSYVHQMLSRRLRDVQSFSNGHRPRNTWFSSYPFRRIDHIFVSADLIAARVVVPRTELTKAASDHLPLIADLTWK